MFTTLRKITFVLFASLVSAASFAAESAGSLEGIVKDANGQPVKGAEIRISGKGEKIVATTKTDAKGHYSSQSLAVGVYKVDLLMNSKLQASIANVQTKSGRSTQANFDLKLTKAEPAKKRKWVVETGSSLGHWEEVDENGNVINRAGARNIIKGDASALQKMQDSGR
jgi:hypothetical protein